MMNVDGVPNVRVCAEPVREGATRSAAERPGLARARPARRHGQARRAVHAGRLLLPDDDQAALGVAALREVPAQRRRARQARQARDRAQTATTPSTAAPRCWSSAAARPGARRRGEHAAAGRQVVLVDEGFVDRPRRRSRSSRPDARSGSTRAGSSPSTRATSSTASAPSGSSSPPATIEQPLVFPGNDLVGVMLPDGVRRLVEDWAHQAGRAAVVVTADDAGREAAAGTLERRASRSGGVYDLRRERIREIVARGRGGRAPLRRDRRAQARLRPARHVRRAPARLLPARPGGRADRVRPRARHLRPHRPPGRTSRPSAPSPGEGLAGAVPAASYNGAVREGQVLRLRLRGRHRQGLKRAIARGLRLDRARQALHDRDDGPLPGPALPRPLDPPLRARERDGRGDDRHDDRAAALGAGDARPPRRAARTSRPSARRSTTATRSSARR